MSSDGRKIGIYFLRVTLVFGLYLVAGRLGLAAPFTSGNVSPFWPAAGIALAGVLLWGYEMWPGIALAAFLVNYLSPLPALAAAGMALGNTLAALVAGSVLRQARFDSKLERLRDVVALIALAALASPLVSALAGNTTLSLAHVKAWSGFRAALAVWWFGDAMGILITAPVVLGLARIGSSEERVFRPELIFLFIGSALAALVTFSHSFSVRAGDDVLVFAAFPFVIWAAVRFALPGASMVCLLITLIAVWGTAHGNGPFVKHGPLYNAVLLQLFLAALSVIGLLLAAIIGERTRAEGALRTLSGHLLRLQDAERRRLARELHDSSGQHLVALQMSLAALRQRVHNDAASTELIAESQQTLERVVKEIRTLSYLLHPPLLDEVGLCSALRWYVDGLVARSQLQIELSLPSELARLSQEVETAIFRIVQESLTNIYRHSGSPVAKVELNISDERLVLRVIDRGKGIGSGVGDPLADPSILGVGIRGIRERVRELGGRLRIKNLMPGALVEVTLPLRVEDRAVVRQAQGSVQGQPQNA